jgi:RsiW-degrading membrane proteinase PrsW (M82 family)
MHKIEILSICIINPLLYFIVIYLTDRLEREPLVKIAKAVGWGAIPAVILSSLGSYPFSKVGLLAVAPIIEEASKGIYVLKMRKDPELEGPMDGLVYGGAVGLGFEIVENAIYSIPTLRIDISAIRSIACGHILFTGLFGFTVGLAKIKGNKSLMLYGYAGAVLLHLVWNGLVSIHGIFYFLLLPPFILIFIWLLRVAWEYDNIKGKKVH